MSREIAVLLAAFLGGVLAQSHRLFDFFWAKPQQQKRIKAMVIADIQAMVTMTEAFDLNNVLDRFLGDADCTMPTLVDPSLPIDASYVLFQENIVAFNPTEAASVTGFFRYVRASRAATLALTVKDIDQTFKATMITAAKTNWNAAKKEAAKLGVESTDAK